MMPLMGLLALGAITMLQGSPPRNGNGNGNGLDFSRGGGEPFPIMMGGGNGNGNGNGGNDGGDVDDTPDPVRAPRPISDPGPVYVPPPDPDVECAGLTGRARLICMGRQMMRGPAMVAQTVKQKPMGYR